MQWEVYNAKHWKWIATTWWSHVKLLCNNGPGFILQLSCQSNKLVAINRVCAVQKKRAPEVHKWVPGHDHLYFFLGLCVNQLSILSVSLRHYVYFSLLHFFLIRSRILIITPGLIEKNNNICLLEGLVQICVNDNLMMITQLVCTMSLKLWVV